MRTCIAIDLKSFYASVECVDRGLDPLKANLVVADASRTDKTICLAVSPSLKSYGIPGRPRLFEVVQQVAKINAERRKRGPLTGSSKDNEEVLADPSLALDFHIATPRMAHYMEVSARIYGIYLRYVAPEDIHVYSIDEVFIEATEYLKMYRLSAHDFAMRLVRDVLAETGITATAGIGTNLYLAKIAMDIEAKHQKADKDGVRVAELDEMSYRRKYWNHRPLTDFWRVGRGIAARLEANGLFTMGDIARCSLGAPYQRYNEGLLYKLFGINAELLIDHAWGWEPCTMADIKAYRPSTNSLSSGQVLAEPYDCAKARIIVLEMADSLVLDMVEKGLLTDQMTLSLSYDTENLSDPVRRRTSSTEKILKAVGELFDRIADPALLVRRVTLGAGRVIREDAPDGAQLDLFSNPVADERERSRQEAILTIRKKFGKNAILKGMNFEEGATAVERNKQIGGHKA